MAQAQSRLTSTLVGCSLFFHHRLSFLVTRLSGTRHHTPPCACAVMTTTLDRLRLFANVPLLNEHMYVCTYPDKQRGRGSRCTPPPHKTHELEIRPQGPAWRVPPLACVPAVTTSSAAHLGLYAMDAASQHVREAQYKLDPIHGHTRIIRHGTHATYTARHRRRNGPRSWPRHRGGS